MDEQGTVGALSQLAYGQPGGNPTFAQVPELLDQLVPKNNERNQWLAFGAAMGQPTRTGALTEALSAGAGAQSASRLEEMKLRAQYMPLIMNALVQNQQMTLSAGNAGRDWLKDAVPKVDAHLAAMRTANAKPGYGEVVQRILQLGQEYQLPSHLLMSKIQSLPRDQEGLAGYLDRLAVGTAGAKELLPTVSTNAAGVQTGVSAVRNTAVPLGSPLAGQAGAQGDPLSNNPSSTFVDWVKNTQGDVKMYEEGLRGRVDAYRNMLGRMNEQAEYMKNFQPGKYAGMAGGIAAAIKDIGSRLPGVDKKTVEDIAAKLVGAAPGSPQSIAAIQMFDQLSKQETLAQLKTALGENQRMNIAEYANFQNANLGKLMDPETFEGMRKFYYKQASDAVNRYKGWAEYAGDPNNKRPSVTAFDARYADKEFNHMLSGDTNILEPGKPGNVAPTYPGYTPDPLAATKAPPPAPAAPAAAPPPAHAAQSGGVDLSQYETGARIGPTGKVYVLDKGMPRPAKPKGGGAAPAPTARTPVNDGLAVSLNGQGPASVAVRSRPTFMPPDDGLTVTPTPSN